MSRKQKRKPLEIVAIVMLSIIGIVILATLRVHHLNREDGTRSG